MDWRNRGFDPDDDKLESLNYALERLKALDIKLKYARARIDQINYDVKFVQMIGDNRMLEDEFWEDMDPRDVEDV